MATSVRNAPWVDYYFLYTKTALGSLQKKKLRILEHFIMLCVLRQMLCLVSNIIKMQLDGGKEYFSNKTVIMLASDHMNILR